jgi:hypothetical protein
MRELRVVFCPVRAGKPVRIEGLVLERLAPRICRGGAVGPSYPRGSLMVMSPRACGPSCSPLLQMPSILLCAWERAQKLDLEVD